MSERGLFRFVLRAMTSPVTLYLLGGSLLGAIAAGIHLGESAVGLIHPIHFQGPAVHPRDRGAAIDERSLPQPSRTAYADLYGWDEGQAALAAECVGCESVRVHRAAAYSAEVPYFGSKEERRDTRQPRDDMGEGLAQSPVPVGSGPAPVLRYAYYPITEEEAVSDDSGGEPASDASVKGTGD